MKSLGFAARADITEETKNSSAERMSTQIMSIVMQYRRFVGDTSCKGAFCPKCMAPHFEKVMAAVLSRKPIKFVLPAFPGKSPNPNKALGPLPDKAERLALESLNDLCELIKKHYAPGAQMIIASDGRVFSDIVGMREEDVSDYLHEIDRLINELNLKNISTFALDELYEEKNLDQMRLRLMRDYGSSLESLRESVKRGGNGSEDRDDLEAHRIYCGITRFLVEDSMNPTQTKSRTAIQKDCRSRAYEVILRSNAWSRLIAEHFSDAIRLSIHPQTCGALKLGIKLLESDSWMTPWHGVAVDTKNGFILMKRWQAAEMKAQLIYDSKGRPSHFRLAQEVFKKGVQYAD